MRQTRTGVHIETDIVQRRNELLVDERTGFTTDYVHSLTEQNGIDEDRKRKKRKERKAKKAKKERKKEKKRKKRKEKKRERSITSYSVEGNGSSSVELHAPRAQRA